MDITSYPSIPRHGCNPSMLEEVHSELTRIVEEGEEGGAGDRTEIGEIGGDMSPRRSLFNLSIIVYVD